MYWRRLKADDCDWEIRVIAAEARVGPASENREEILEFRSVDAIRPPRRAFVTAGLLEGMSDTDLLSIYRRARPIGGDYYGRPGKRMPDARA